MGLTFFGSSVLFYSPPDSASSFCRLLFFPEALPAFLAISLRSSGVNENFRAIPPFRPSFWALGSLRFFFAMAGSYGLGAMLINSII